jgi:hypothetical protein
MPLAQLKEKFGILPRAKDQHGPKIKLPFGLVMTWTTVPELAESVLASEL